MKQIEMFGLTENEMNLICDSLNGITYHLSDSLWRINTLSNLMDANEFENLGEKWEVNFENLIEKLNSLSDIEFLLVLLEVMYFWGELGRHYKPFDLIPPHQKIIEILSESKRE